MATETCRFDVLLSSGCCILLQLTRPNSHWGLRKDRKGRRVSLEQIVIHAIHGVMVHNCKDEAVPRFS